MSISIIIFHILKNSAMCFMIINSNFVFNYYHITLKSTLLPDKVHIFNEKIFLINNPLETFSQH